MLIGNANSSLTLKESLKLRVVWEGSTWVSWLESEMLELKPENSCYETTDMCFYFFFLETITFILVSDMKRNLENRERMNCRMAGKAEVLWCYWL